jgi:sulfur carrier protein
VKVIVNGDPREVPENATVATVIEGVAPSLTGVAVALNDEVVRRAEWAATTVREADRLEVLTAVQGG